MKGRVTGISQPRVRAHSKRCRNGRISSYATPPKGDTYDKVVAPDAAFVEVAGHARNGHATDRMGLRIDFPADLLPIPFLQNGAQEVLDGLEALFIRFGI